MPYYKINENGERVRINAYEEIRNLYRSSVSFLEKFSNKKKEDDPEKISTQTENLLANSKLLRKAFGNKNG